MPTAETQKDLDTLLHYTERVGSRPPENNPIKRAMDMLFRAQATWPVIAEEEGGLKEAFIPYMVIIGFVPGLIGSILNVALWGTIGAMFGAAHEVSSMTSMVLGSVARLAYGMFGILVFAKFVELVAPSFGGRKSWVLATRAVVYGSTPAAAAAVIIWIPVLGWFVGFVSMIWTILLTLRGFKSLLAKPAAPRADKTPEKAEVRERALTAI